MNTADFKTARRWNAFNRFLQIIFAISLALSLNYLASRSNLHRRYEIAPSQSHALALETRKQIEGVARNVPDNISKESPWVTIYLTLSTNGLATDSKDYASVSALLKQLQNLLDDLQFSAAQTGRANWLRIEQTDNLRRAAILASLQARYPGIDANTVLVVTCKDRERDRCKIIAFPEIIAMRQGSKEPLFTGEEALASALLSVTGEKPPLVYYTTGHREMSPLVPGADGFAKADTSPDGLAKLEDKLNARNIRFLPLDLAKVNEVPTDADLLYLPAPKAAIPPAETEKLRRYMRERNGRMIAFLNPGAPLGSLEDLFADWGILVQDARVHDLSPDASDAQENLLIRVRTPADAKDLATIAPDGLRLAFAKARPVREDPAAPTDDTRRVTRLAATNINPAGKIVAWGETNYNQPQSTWAYDPVRDLEAPVSVAVVSERAPGMRLNLGSTAGRLLVIGSGDIASNDRINSYENDFFLLNITNWMLDRTQFLGIRPHSMSGFQLAATNADLTRVARWFALLPLGALLLGLAVFFWRRNM
ncbi:MAG: GldG family protein [Puniceicoccales bacterium]|jgi:hypothetical protein|nr:GldG family protein [Puniceicoccales bacterium]